MAEIDSLEIQIKAQATKANNAIDKLITKLDKLSTSLNSINTSNLNGLANSVNRLSNAMQSMNNVKTTDFTRLAKGIEKISTVDTTKINRAASSMNQLSKAFGNIQASSSATAQISELAKGISQLGYKSSTKAIENIPKLATAMQGLMTTLSKAPTVNRNLIDMTNALAKLARTGASSGRAANSLASSLNVFSKSAKSAKINSFSLASAFGKLYASYWLLFRAFHKLGEAIDISSSLTEVENVVRTTFGNYEKLIQDFSKTSIQDFGMSELMAKQVASRFQAMGVAMGFSQKNMANMSLELTKLTADMASFYDMSQTDVARNLQAIFTGETEPLRKYGLDLTQATLKEWALKQGLDADITSMTQAQKAMLRYQYVMQNTAAAQGDFARTADTWHNQITVLTQSFQQLASIIGGALINAFKPFVRTLNQVMQYVIAFAETVTNALGSIFGWQYEVSAGGVAEDWADGMEDFSDATGDAAKNAKKLKNNLLGIDELNINSGDNDKNGSSAGGGASKVDKTQGGLVQVDTIFKGYESSIKTLEQLGNKVRDALIGAMDSIEWDNVFEKARNFGTGLADFLNGLLDYDGEGRTLFGKVAQTLANTLNAIVYAAQSFAITFDFYQFGVNLADAINNFFDTFDFKAFADTLNKWVDGLENTIKGFLDKVNWKTVFNGLYDFFSNLEIDTVEFIVGTFILKKFGTLRVASGIWDSLVKSIKLALDFGLKKGIGYSGLLINLTSFSVAFSPNLAAIWSTIEDQFLKGTIFDTNTWTGFPAKVNDAINNAIDSVGNFLVNAMRETLTTLFNWDETLSLFEQAKDNFKKGGVYILEGILDGFAGAIAFILEPVKDLFTAIYNAICDVFGIHSPAETMKPLGEYIFLGIIEGFTSLFDTFTEKINEFWENYVLPWFTIEKWTELLGNILVAAQTKWDEIVEWWNGTALVTWWEESVVPWFSLEKWLEVLNNVKESFNTKWTETSTQWVANLTKWWNVNVAPWFTKKKWDDMLAKVPTAFKDAFKAAANGAIGFLNGVIEGVESLVNRAIDGLKKLAEVASKIPGVSFSIDIPNVSLPRIPKFSTGGFPETGSLFYANEAGPELVGTIGGKTAVAPNGEITGIKEAVYDSGTNTAQLLSTAIQLLQIIADKDSTINIDGRELVKATDERRNRNGFSFA